MADAAELGAALLEAAEDGLGLPERWQEASYADRRSAFLTALRAGNLVTAEVIAVLKCDFSQN